MLYVFRRALFRWRKIEFHTLDQAFSNDLAKFLHQLL